MTLSGLLLLCVLFVFVCDCLCFVFIAYVRVVCVTCRVMLHELWLCLSVSV